MDARKRGLLLRPIGNVIVLMPPLMTPIKELKDMVEIIHHSISAITTSTYA
jgi:adenosylmethionine-8-amino-7-oxononanoate aminotransferase